MPRKGPAPKHPVISRPGIRLAASHSTGQQGADSTGKKSVAERIVYGALEGCREKNGADPVVTLKRALDNVKPTLEVQAAVVSVAPPTRCRSRCAPRRSTTLGPALARRSTAAVSVARRP